MACDRRMPNMQCRIVCWILHLCGDFFAVLISTVVGLMPGVIGSYRHTNNNERRYDERQTATAKSAHATLGIYFARLYGKWFDRVGALILCRTLHSNKNWLFSREFSQWTREREREIESERKTHAHVMSFEFVEYIFFESVIDPFTVVHGDWITLLTDQMHKHTQLISNFMWTQTHTLAHPIDTKVADSIKYLWSDTIHSYIYAFIYTRYDTMV